MGKYGVRAGAMLFDFAIYPREDILCLVCNVYVRCMYGADE